MPVQVPGHVSDACMAVALYQHCLSWLNLSVECWDMPNVLLVKTEAVGVPEQVLLAGLTLTQLHYGNNGGSSGGRPCRPPERPSLCMHCSVWPAPVMRGLHTLLHACGQL